MTDIQKNKCRYILSVILLFSTSLHADQCLTPQKLTEQIYKKYFIGNGNNVKTITSSNKQNLEKYLTQSLAKKIDDDNKCQAKTRMVCNLEFDILTYAQDIPEKPHYQIIPISDTQVNTFITGVGYKDKVIFKFAKENGCIKVNDIIYSDKTSLSYLLK